MKIIVDANIIFSGILNSNGKIGDISGMTMEHVREAEFQLCKDILFISEELISRSVWQAAIKLVMDIDPKDAPYVAFSKYFRCRLWSGDKALQKGLRKKGFDNFISTNDLFQLRQSKAKSFKG